MGHERPPGNFAIDVKCERCGAERDAPCVDLGEANEHFAGTYHIERSQAAAAITRAANIARRKERS